MILTMDLILLFFIKIVNGGKILLVPIAGSPLRSTMYYGKKLAERGHEITLLCGLPNKINIT